MPKVPGCSPAKIREAVSKTRHDYEATWHLDKRVPIALLLALFFQTSGAVWWASQIDVRVRQLESRVAGRSDDGDRLIALEINMGLVQRQLVSVSGKLDTLIDQFHRISAAN